MLNKEGKVQVSDTRMLKVVTGVGTYLEITDERMIENALMHAAYQNSLNVMVKLNVLNRQLSSTNCQLNSTFAQNFENI